MAIFGASVAVTFKPMGARADAVIAAAWSCLWPGFAVGAGLACAATVIGILARPRRAGSRWVSFPLLHATAVLAAPAASGALLAEERYLRPGLWPYIAAAAAFGHCGAVLGEILHNRAPLHALSSPVALALAVCLSAAPALAAHAPRTPTLGAQLNTDHALARHVPLRRCHHLPVDYHGALLRDSLIGEIDCAESGLYSAFLAFRSATLLELYAAQRAASAGVHSGSSTGPCVGSGPSSSAWSQSTNGADTHGRLLCYGTGHSATIEWSEAPGDVYAIVHDGSRARLYSWWQRHRTIDLPGSGG